jgi:UDP-N-acetylglucosamine--N-acetylmuramyl-(pentapeptide) pyrophosphoryl-undecaprenol N-acetylglucosamine transferase
MSKHVIIAAGGTGGHVIPAQVVAEQLQKEGISSSFAAFGLSQNPFFDRSKWTFHDIPSAPPSLSVRFFSSTAKGLGRALRLMRKERPSLVVGFGSYHALPVLSAASILRIPIVLYAADSVPGRVVRLFAPLAQWTGCFFEEATARIRGKTYHVDFPLRSSFHTSPTKQEGCSYFSIDHHLPTVLILGGSQGARALNVVVPAALAKLKKPITVIHLAGNDADLGAIAAAYHQMAIKASVRGYENAMHNAFAAADLVIARSGASTIAEVEACQKPAMYIPYPHAMDDHQKKNAVLAAARGRAVVIGEGEATPELIANSIESLLEPCSKQCGNLHPSSEAFVTKIIQTIDEAAPCRKR